jgi:hypothetical protein
VLDAARALNALAMREDVDPYDGLRMLLGWKPDGPDVTREAAAVQIADRLRAQTALVDLPIDTLGWIVRLADGNNDGAKQVLQALREFLAATNDKAELTSHIQSWKQGAKDVIEAVLEVQAREPEQPKSGKTVQVSREGRRSWRVESAQVEVGDQTVSLVPADVEAVVGQVLNRLGADVGAQNEIIIRIVLARDRE